MSFGIVQYRFALFHLKMKILILEDDKALLSALVLFLKRGGHLTFAVETAKSACQLLEQEAFDLVITDRQLPDDNGELKTLHFSKQLNPSTPVIIMSGEYSDDIVAGVMVAGANHFLPKPFQLHEFLNLVARFKKA